MSVRACVCVSDSGEGALERLIISDTPISPDERSDLSVNLSRRRPPMTRQAEAHIQYVCNQTGQHGATFDLSVSVGLKEFMNSV